MTLRTRFLQRQHTNVNTPTIAYVGSRTTPERGTGTGISSFSIIDGRWTLLNETPAVNPGFLAIDPVHTVLHAAGGDQDYVTSYKMLDDGKLDELGRQPTLGTNPAHIVLVPSGRYVLVANHTGGSVVSLPILSDGSLGPVAGQLKFTGTPGPHRTDQNGSKPHQVVFSPAGDYFLVPDKGLDTVFTCRLNPQTGGIEFTGSIHLRELSGPRHGIFHPHLARAYVINELNSTITVLDCGSPGNLGAVQILPTTEDMDTRDSRAAGVALSADGKFLYASNRSGAGDKTPGGPGEDTIAVYPVKDDGTLSPAAWIKTGGIRPRFITLSLNGETLYAANEKSGTIQAFDLDSKSGLSGPGRQVAATGSPVCIVFNH